jgi:hypothetical protein
MSALAEMTKRTDTNSYVRSRERYTIQVDKPSNSSFKPREQPEEQETYTKAKRVLIDKDKALALIHSAYGKHSPVAEEMYIMLVRILGKTKDKPFLVGECPDGKFKGGAVVVGSNPRYDDLVAVVMPKAAILEVV